MEKTRVTILGVGNILLTDEGFGIRVVEALEKRYKFFGEVKIIDGGVLGLSLLGVISETDHLIVVDAIRNDGGSGDLYRIEGEDIPQRILAKNSLHQVDLLEALTLCQALGKVPETVIIGVEPEDLTTLGLELTPRIQARMEAVIDMVLRELDRLGVCYTKVSPIHVPCDSL